MVNDGVHESFRRPAPDIQGLLMRGPVALTSLSPLLLQSLWVGLASLEVLHYKCLQMCFAYDGLVAGALWDHCCHGHQLLSKLTSVAPLLLALLVVRTLVFWLPS